MPNKSLYLLHPRYWLTWLGLGVLYLVTKLPYPHQLNLGKALGRVSFYLLGRFRHIAKINLRLCFPELSRKAQHLLLKKHFESLGIGLVESAMAWWMPDHRLQTLLQIQGLDHLQQALQKNQGLLILSAHFTSLDLCGRLFSNVFPMYVVYREQKNQVVDALLKRYRKFKRMQPLHRQSIRQIIKILKQGSAIWYAADQDYGAAHSVFSRFFNIPAATITTPSRYARSTQAQAVTLFYHRLPQAKGYQITISPILESFAQNNDEQNTLLFNQRLEDYIRHYPEQYLWIHRRFKTRSTNETPFY